MSRILKPVAKINKTQEIDASTMSVILKDSDTVHCWLSLRGEDANITLRFDRGPKAVICGYPQTWDIHDVPVDPYDSESPTGAELFECDAIQDSRTYVSADDECALLKILLKSVSKQFRDPDWIDCCPTEFRKRTILRKIERTIKSLEEN